MLPNTLFDTYLYIHQAFEDRADYMLAMAAFFIKAVNYFLPN